MEDLLRFLTQYEIWIYTLWGLLALVFLQRLVIAWQERNNALFGLEKENAQHNVSYAFTILLLLGLLVGAEFFIVTFVTPLYPGIHILPTPTMNVLVTPTATLRSDNPLAVPTPTMGVTGTPGTARPGGPTPVPSRSASEGCVVGKIEWLNPNQGQTIQGNVELRGTVNIPSLGYFKYEYAQAGKNVWTTIAAGNQPKINGQIGFWNTSRLVPGDYLLRLVVVDNQNQTFPACIISLRVIAAQP